MEETINEINEAIAEFIKENRKDSKMTQAKLARLLDIDQSMVSRLEKPGEIEYTINTLLKIADIFNMDMEINFVDREED